MLTADSYLTYCNIEGNYDEGSLLRLLAHELSHRFSSDASKKAYADAARRDKFFNRTRWFLSYPYGSPGDEEEFVQAIDRTIMVRHGVETYDDVIEGFKDYYCCSVPIAIILFNELRKLGELPDDINDWICALFSDGTIRIGEIERQVDSIIQGYSKRFDFYWNERKAKYPETFKEYVEF